MVTDSGGGEAAEMAALLLDRGVGAGDESRTRDPAHPSAAWEALGQGWHRLCSQLDDSVSLRLPN